MNLYTQEDINRLDATRQVNDSVEARFTQIVEDLTDEINSFSERLSHRISSTSGGDIAQLQADILVKSQNLTKDITFYKMQYAKVSARMADKKAEKLLHFATGFAFKASVGQQAVLVDAMIREEERAVQLIVNHMEFINQSRDTLKSMMFAIKSQIELVGYLGKSSYA